ncbi:MAG: hypothetical protein M3063_08275 [Actinomycetota bacterium]|nr:hypothetical protein [Actinomycetota bacterium]
MVERQHFSVGAEKTRVSRAGTLASRRTGQRVSPNDHFAQHAVDIDGYTLCRSVRWPAATTFPDLDWEDSAPQARCPDCTAAYEDVNPPAG